MKNLQLKNRLRIVTHALKIHAESNQHFKDICYNIFAENGDIDTLLKILRDKNYSSVELTHRLKELNGCFESPEIKSVMNVGSEYQCSVKIINLSSKVWFTTIDTPIYLCYHWLNLSGEPHIYEGVRTSIDVEIYPGEERCISLRVIPPIHPNDYILELTMVKENYSWGEFLGFMPSRKNIKVLSDIKRPDKDFYLESIYSRLINGFQNLNSNLTCMN